MDVWRRAVGVLLLGAAVTAVMDRLVFSGESRVGDLRGLHLAWSVAATLMAAAAACLVWPRASRQAVDLSELPEAPLLRAQRRMLAHSFARSLSHDGNNILLAIRFRIAELARLEQDRVHGAPPSGSSTLPKEAEPASLIHELGHACDEFEVMLGRLRELGMAHDKLVLNSINLEEALPRILDFAGGHADVRMAAPKLEVHPGLAVRADSVLLRQMVTNLLLNASQAAGRGEPVMIKARCADGQALIEIHDAGPGLSAGAEEAASTAAEIFRSDNPDGSGLGLWAARTCADVLGGQLEFVPSDKLGGTCARITLPAVS
jgi:signal transduction histidine kinase